MNRSPITLPAAAFTAAALFCLPGCAARAPSNTVEVAPGVTFRRDDKAGVQLLDVDLAVARVTPQIVAEHVEKRGGNYVGDARTVREWAEKYHALAGVNGGFFGDTYDQVGRRKQIVQLAVAGGAVVAPGGAMTSARVPGERYLRSALGFTAQGVPDISWGTGNARSGSRCRRAGPLVGPEATARWPVVSAVACGPRLFRAGVRRITDHEERLVSPGPLPRAFAVYDHENGAPRHLVLGRASAMDFAQVAAFLTDYFASVHHSAPREGLCLDGGPSAQVVYRDPQSGEWRDAEPTGVLVPTALLLVPRLSASREK